jgi:hypothetical protein
MGRKGVRLMLCLVLLAACHHAVPNQLGRLPPDPSVSPGVRRTLYRQHKMDRIAHYLSKYWDGGNGDPFDVYNLALSHESATGCRFGVFHAYQRHGDLAFAHARHAARIRLRAMGADAVGFGQYHGDWWAVTEDCA